MVGVKKGPVVSTPPRSRLQELQFYGDESSGMSPWAEKMMICGAWTFLVLTFPITAFYAYKVVKQYERVVTLRNGKVVKLKNSGPGCVMNLPCIDDVEVVDLRTVVFDVPPQEVLTKDSLSVSVDAVIFYHIEDPESALLRVGDYEQSTQLLAATTLRHHIGNRTLSELLGERKIISREIFREMKKTTFDWGISVVRVDIKDISMPHQLQKAMAAEAESSRLANAKITIANAEIESTKSLNIATQMLLENPYAMQLRYLQSLHSIVNEKSHVVVLPISSNFLGHR